MGPSSKWDGVDRKRRRTGGAKISGLWSSSSSSNISCRPPAPEADFVSHRGAFFSLFVRFDVASLLDTGFCELLELWSDAEVVGCVAGVCRDREDEEEEEFVVVAEVAVVVVGSVVLRLFGMFGADGKG